ncbi:MAG: biosynthetic-type acetolactate synthase large subunit [Lachnospiraceae bacterium]|nr:biosynthetic-type acetolactate synthase large subunit [Lachnospiraceae bacterium]
MLGAEAVVKALSQEGVEYVFGYPGVAICPFYEAITHSDIKTVLVRTEQSAAHMASGLARVSGKVGVCAVTSGPGATNLITGIATAFADSIPLVCITGQVNSALLGSDVFQEADITGAAESFVKYSYLVKDPQDIPRVIKEAFHIASTGRKGPVLIDIPIDVQNAEIRKFKYPDEVSMRTYKPTFVGNYAQIKKTVKALSKAERPVICVGGGVLLSNAKDSLRTFVEKYNIPVVSTMMGIGAMPTEHPLYFGMVGNNGKPWANKAMNESDLLIMVGARVADRAVNQPDIITENKVMVHIDVDPAEIGKNCGPTIPIVGDADNIFNQLNSFEEEIEIDTKDWLKTLQGFKKDLFVKRKVNPEFVDPECFIKTLSDMLDKEAIYVADVGQNQIWSCSFHVVKEGKFLTTGGMGTMGYSIPAALGAKLACPDKQVVAVCGDGAFQMSMMELATIKQEDVPVKIIVLKNGFLGMVREYQHYTYKDNYSVVKLNDYPDLKKISEAYSMDYIKVSVDAEIKDGVSKMLSSSNSCIMEVTVDPMDLAKG